ncbi:flagellar biosynthesis protein FlhF [bacterium]|nr:flagellar biosynthesis protein FlhF [bacterium]
MEVKKFEAPTLQEALETVKRELGPEAIILQTKKNKRGFGLMNKASVEVTAAVSERSMVKKKATESRISTDASGRYVALSASQQADLQDEMMDKLLNRAVSDTRDSVQISAQASPQVSLSKPRTAIRYAEIDADTLPTPPAQQAARPAGASAGRPINSYSNSRAEASSLSQSDPSDEVRALRRMVEDLKAQQDQRGASTDVSVFSTPTLQEAFDQLVVNGVDKRFALALIRQASFELGAEGSKSIDAVQDQIAEEIIRGIEVASPLEGVVPGTGVPTVMALVGPTGVGKTTTLAKIAAQAIRRGLRVGLINLDHVKASAFDQLATFSRVLNVPFRSAQSVDDLTFAIRDFQALDLILVDTTGRSQRDPASLREIQSMLDTIPTMKTVLVLSATTRDAELYDMAARFSLFRPQGLVFSKLDETTLYGVLYNVPQKVRLPLLYFTTGQKVPEDIEEASKDRVAALVMDL